MRHMNFLLFTTLTWATMFLTPSYGAGTDRQTNPSRILDQKTQNFVVHTERIVNAFSLVMENARLSGGMIIDREKENSMKVDFAIAPGESFRDALDRVVAANPHFRWQINGNSIVIVPVTGVPEILDTRISRFDFDDIDNRSLVVGALFNTPEIHKRMSELGFDLVDDGVGGVFIYSSPSKRPPQRSVHLIDVTLMEALNLIAQKRGEGFWVYKEFTLGGTRCVTVTFIR